MKKIKVLLDVNYYYILVKINYIKFGCYDIWDKLLINFFFSTSHLVVPTFESFREANFKTLRKLNWMPDLEGCEILASNFLLIFKWLKVARSGKWVLENRVGLFLWNLETSSCPNFPSFVIARYLVLQFFKTKATFPEYFCPKFLNQNTRWHKNYNGRVMW